MDEKVIRFDLSAETLLDIAEKKLDEKDHIGALRVLRKSVERNGATVDEYEVFADIYDEMELFEMSADYWYKFLDACAEEEAVDAYEGLAACYYNMGNERQAAYYYNLMVEDKFVTPENNIEMGELFSSAAKRPFRVVYPPSEADYAQELEEGLRCLRGGDYAGADEKFASVPPASKNYSGACNFLALSKLMQGKADEAEAVCLERLRQDEDNIPLLSTYAAVLTEQGRGAESRAVAKRLAAMSVSSVDDLYKIATVCCENKLYEEAYEKFCLLEKQVSYDLTLLYFKAVAAFKGGRVKESLAGFAKIIDIFPDAAVARYYFGEIRRYAEEGGDAPETMFFYRLPLSEREARVKLLAALAEIPQSDLRAFLADIDLTEYVEWCFDEADGMDIELMLLGMRVAVKAGMDDFVRDMLLESGRNDLVKVEGVRYLAERNRSFTAGVVISDFYRRISFDKLSVGRTKHAKFLHAYALCFARFALLGDGSGEDYKAAAERIYGALERASAMDAVSDEASLACAIYFISSRNALKRTQEILQMLKGNGENVAHILHIVNADVEKEIAVTSEKEKRPRAGAADGKE